MLLYVTCVRQIRPADEIALGTRTIVNLCEGGSCQMTLPLQTLILHAVRSILILNIEKDISSDKHG